MPFKFIHAADIHLDSPLKGLERYEGAPVESVRLASRRAFENLIDLAIIQKVAFVIIAGDLFDGDWKDYNTGLYFVKQMSRLKQAEIPVYLVKGNHDAANKLTRSLPMPENVHVFSHRHPETFSIDELSVSIHGQSFSTADLKEDISSNYPAARKGHFNIGVLHTCASGREGHDAYAPCKVAGLLSKGYDYWALGHIHKREILNQDPLIVFPGNIQGRHIRESGPKGCYLLTVDDRFKVQEEFLQLAVMQWENLTVNLESAKNEDEAFQLISETISRLLETTGELPLAARINLEGRSELDLQIRSQRRRFVESIRALAMQEAPDSCWIEKVKINTKPMHDSEFEEHFDGALAELLSLINETRSDQDAIQDLKDELQDLRNRLPAELKEASLLGSNQWIESNLDDVKQILLDRLLRPEAAK